MRKKFEYTVLAEIVRVHEWLDERNGKLILTINFKDRDPGVEFPFKNDLTKEEAIEFAKSFVDMMNAKTMPGTSVKELVDSHAEDVLKAIQRGITDPTQYDIENKLKFIQHLIEKFPDLNTKMDAYVEWKIFSNQEVFK